MQRLGRVIGNVLAVMLAVYSLQAMADAQLAGRDFNHAATGFPLTGGHATAACETCHVAGVFKGTAKTCDGCHALGKRVVATPMPTTHIVTDAPCDSCHFNASTFLGARFNHGIAVPGQCATCHNGRQSTGRPASHSMGLKATDSCDHCHRTYAFLPSSWNHVGVAPHTCDNPGCHVQGSNQYFRSGSTHTRLGMATYYCDECHKYGTWLTALFIHDRPAPSGVCMGCHDGVTAIGKVPTHGITSSDCNTCHFNTVTWLGASYHNGNIAGICGNCHNGTNNVKGTMNDPNGTHIPITVGLGSPNCDFCHISTTTFTAFVMNHSGITTCNSCHSTTSIYVVNTKRTPGSHQISTASQDCSNCHSTTTWAGALGAMPSNHIPFNAGILCSNCHPTPTTWVTGATLHAYVTSYTCAACHISPNSYTGNGQQTKSSHSGSSGSNCTTCHQHTNAGSYVSWN
jgi:hypothetical protein